MRLNREEVEEILMIFRDQFLKARGREDQRTTTVMEDGTVLIGRDDYHIE